MKDDSKQTRPPIREAILKLFRGQPDLRLTASNVTHRLHGWYEEGSVRLALGELERERLMQSFISKRTTIYKLRLDNVAPTSPLLTAKPYVPPSTMTERMAQIRAERAAIPSKG